MLTGLEKECDLGSALHVSAVIAEKALEITCYIFSRPGELTGGAVGGRIGLVEDPQVASSLSRTRHRV